MIRTLRWEPQSGLPRAEYAYSGELVVGMIGERTATPGRWWYSATDAVSMKYIAKGKGEVASRAAARNAVERAWATWLKAAALSPDIRKA